MRLSIFYGTVVAEPKIKIVKGLPVTSFVLEVISANKTQNISCLLFRESSVVRLIDIGVIMYVNGTAKAIIGQNSKEPIVQLTINKFRIEKFLNSSDVALFQFLPTVETLEQNDYLL